jgi:hypothetical protein
MSKRKNVPASAVRDWSATPEGTKALTEAGAKFPGSRGRLDPTTLAVFHKENPRMRYETASEAEKPHIVVPVVILDKSGRKTTVKRTLTTEAARAALGHEKGRRGRFNLSDLSDVLSQAEAALVADTFTLAA